MAKNIVSTLTVRLVQQVAGPAEAAVKGIEGIGRAVKGLDKLGSRAMDRLQAASKALAKDAAALDKIADFKLLKRGLTDAAQAYRLAQQQARALKAELAGVEKVSARQQQALNRATREVERTKAAFMSQGQAVRAASAGLNAAGISVRSLADAEARLKANVLGANEALKKQADAAVRSAKRREAAGVLASGAGVAAAYQGKQIARKALDAAAEFDIGVRKQRVFTDLTPEDQKALIAQALRVGQDTPYTNLDVVKAQTKAMQGLPASFSSKLRAEVGEGILDNVKNYAMVMEADLETSAEAIRSYLQTTGKDISTKEKALKESNKATNQLVKMAKLGGMSDEDVQQFMKFAASPGSVAGLSSESMMALGALARRGGLRGDEAGVAMRSMASKLSSPTQQGLAAMDAAGITYSKYKTMPESLNREGLSSHFKRRLGKGFSADSTAAIDKALNDPTVLQDQGRFVEAVTKAVEKQFGQKTKKGETRASDLKAISKTAREFYKAQGGKVDMERLVADLMASNLSLDQLNAILTDKHGGKFAVTQKQRDEYNASRKGIVDAGNDPDFAKKKAEEIYGGFGGAVKKLEGAIETFYQQLGTSNEAWLKPLITTTGDLVDKFSSLSATTQQIVTVLGIAGIGAAGAAGTMGLVRTLVTGGGAGTALSASAVALDGAATALTAAATRLGGAGAGAGAGAAAGGIMSRVVTMARAGLVGIVAGGVSAAAIDLAERNRTARAAGDTPGKKAASGRRAVLGKGRSEDDARAAIDAMAGEVKPVVDSSDIEKAIKQAGEAKTELAGLGATVRPQVDVSQLDLLISKAGQAHAKLAALGGQIGSFGASGISGGKVAGARAAGGPVSAGKTYLVGEKGPELFTAGASGHITPNGSGGRAAAPSAASGGIGSVTIHVTINGNASKEDGDAIAQKVLERLNRAARNGHINAFADV